MRVRASERGCAWVRACVPESLSYNFYYYYYYYYNPCTRSQRCARESELPGELKNKGNKQARVRWSRKGAILAVAICWER